MAAKGGNGVILVTGGAGFIGSEFVRQGAARGRRIVVVDKVTYAGDPARIASVADRIVFHRADIRHRKALERIFDRHRPDRVVHFAAETHVDRSIHQDPAPFVRTNVEGTLNVVETARRHGVRRFVHISTDEVYGEIGRGAFTEGSPVQPNNPYSATKAAADLLIKAAVRTHGFPALIVRPSNNYGPWQYPEKLIPVVILKALQGEPVPVYGRGQHVREWLYVGDCARAVWFLLAKGRAGEVYNVGSAQERKNIDTVRAVLRAAGVDQGLIRFVEDRPGHDMRYALDFGKVRRLGWRPRVAFSEGVTRTVRWNLENRGWVEGKLRVLRRYWKKVYAS